MANPRLRATAATVQPGQRARFRSGPALTPFRPAVEYRPLFVNALLNENANKTLPFFWTINPYRGCEFACGACFARYTHEFLEHRRPEEFERRIYVKLQAAEILRESLKPGILKGRPVAIGTVTDPYQPAERHFRITRRILEVLARCPDLELSITTKSPLVLEDLDLLREISRDRKVRVNLSMTTLLLDLARLLESRAPSPLRRLETLRRLAQAGISTSVFVMPIYPGITDAPDDLLRLLRRAREAGAEEAHGDLLRLGSAARRSFLPVLERHFPHLTGVYRRLYDEAGSLGSDERATHADGSQGQALLMMVMAARAAYRRLLRTRFADLRREAGFPEPSSGRVYEPGPGAQLELAI